MAIKGTKRTNWVSAEEFSRSRELEYLDHAPPAPDRHEDLGQEIKRGHGKKLWLCYCGVTFLSSWALADHVRIMDRVARARAKNGR